MAEGKEPIDRLLERLAEIKCEIGGLKGDPEETIGDYRKRQAESQKQQRRNWNLSVYAAAVRHAGSSLSDIREGVMAYTRMSDPHHVPTTALFDRIRCNET